MKKNSELLKIFEKKGIKSTDARHAVLDVVNSAQKPLSAKDIFKKVEKKKIDRVTVYRVLEFFEKKGLIRRVDTMEREIKYETSDTKSDHHHVICTNCKKVADFTGCDADKLITKALKQVKNFKNVSHHTFDIFGLCNSCAK